MDAQQHQGPTAPGRRTYAALALVVALMAAGGGGGEPTTQPTTPPPQGTEHSTDGDAHHELLMEALKDKSSSGKGTAIALTVATITTLGGITVAVITSRTMRRPKRKERRPR